MPIGSSAAALHGMDDQNGYSSENGPTPYFWSGGKGARRGASGPRGGGGGGGSHGREMLPHLFGAHSYQFRSGQSAVNSKQPPSWAPEMALNPTYPYTLAEYKRDVSRWIVSTEVAPERQGPLIALAIDGAARAVVDELDDELLSLGANTDLGDGRGAVHHSGPKLLFPYYRGNFQRMTRCRC